MGNCGRSGDPQLLERSAAESGASLTFVTPTGSPQPSASNKISIGFELNTRRLVKTHE